MIHPYSPLNVRFYYLRISVEIGFPSSYSLVYFFFRLFPHFSLLGPARVRACVRKYFSYSHLMLGRWVCTLYNFISQAAIPYRPFGLSAEWENGNCFKRNDGSIASNVYENYVISIYTIFCVPFFCICLLCVGSFFSLPISAIVLFREARVHQ